MSLTTGLAGLPAFFRLASHQTVDSTNSEALRMAAAGAPGGTLVWSRAQDQGRGRRGRVWSSPAGNLYCSVLLREMGYGPAVSHLAFLTALALRDGIAAAAPSVPVRFKWPNDLLVRRRKIAGILIEGGPAASVVIGTGVNIASHPEGATALAFEGAANVGIEDLLTGYAAALRTWLDLLQDEGFGAVRAAWLASADGIGTAIEVRLPTATLRGTFAELDSEGALLLETESGRHRITAGDVFLEALS